jgi:hypothetical protein
VVGAERAGADSDGKVRGSRGVHPADPVDRGAQGAGDADPRPLRRPRLLGDQLCDPAEDTVGPIATLLYGFSLLYRMTTSLAHGGVGPGTMGLPAARLHDLAARAGFGRVRRVEMDNPFNSLYELWRAG